MRCLMSGSAMPGPSILVLLLLALLGISSTAPGFGITGRYSQTLELTSWIEARQRLIFPGLPALADTSVIRNLNDTHGESYGRPGLSHLTIAGAVHHGMKEVELWLQTFAPGSGTPVHRHDCEEIFLITKGKGTLYLAPASGSPFPGKPDGFSIHANSSFIVPVNAVHQVKNVNLKRNIYKSLVWLKVWNTNEDEDLQHLVIISQPPIKVFTYTDWFTPHADALAVFPYPWDAELKSSGEDQCGSFHPRTSVY